MMKPTDEQLAALELFLGGDSMVVEAGAGTGKTSTLRLFAAATRRRGRYLAFNKAIVTDVQGTISSRVTASTAHSLAFQAIGKRYAHRLRSPRMAPWEIAKNLDIRQIAIKYGEQRKVLGEQYLGGHVMKAVTIFCQTVDETPTRRHFPYIDGIDFPTAEGKRTYDNNNLLAAALEPAMQKAWVDLQQLDGRMRFNHEHYLKIWQLSHPRIPTDFILFDEAQDANPVMAAVVDEQEHAQRVYVGDSCQAIYEFTGAVNTLEKLDTEHRRFLTQSFRFGPEIAAVANEILELLDAPLRLSGLPTIASEVRELDDDDTPDAILTRTNAQAVTSLLDWIAKGVRPHLVGGGREVSSFARGARDLQEKGQTGHPELACFDSWGQVQEYVRSDAQGDELALLVRLVDDFGVETILGAVDGMPREDDAELVISTAHKAKGREWNVVQLAGDFAFPEPSIQELRLRYVASTRARYILDDSAVYPETDATAEPAPA